MISLISYSKMQIQEALCNTKQYKSMIDCSKTIEQEKINRKSKHDKIL